MKMSDGFSSSKGLVEDLRTKKVAVAVEDNQGRLRLRWSYAGRRYCLALGLPTNKANLKAARQKATQIELDIVSGNFDNSLQKYQANRPSKIDTKVSAEDLFREFTTYRSERVAKRTLEKYQLTQQNLIQFFQDKPAKSISTGEAERFVRWFTAAGLGCTTIRARLMLIKAAWNWGIKECRVDFNPWLDLPLLVKIPPQQKPKPFTLEEIVTILQAFRTDRYYHHYSDYVEFLFGTGCRTSEALGLCWKHISDDCSSVWVGESLCRGVRKATKTNRARTVSLTPSLQQMLIRRRPLKPDPEALVFTSPKGTYIDDHNFRNRAWVTILGRLGIPYRKPYTTRHTLISHALEQGMNPVLVAQLTGHDVQTLYQHYAGCVVSRPRLPTLWLPVGESE